MRPCIAEAGFIALQFLIIAIFAAALDSWVAVIACVIAGAVWLRVAIARYLG